MSETSQAYIHALPPAASISFLVSTSFSSPRATSMIFAPAAASLSAAALPIPEDAPVTTTTLSLTRPGSTARRRPVAGYLPTVAQLDVAGVDHRHCVPHRTMGHAPSRELDG